MQTYKELYVLNFFICDFLPGFFLHFSEGVRDLYESLLVEARKEFDKFVVLIDILSVLLFQHSLNCNRK
jgi:hypothetical protein